MQNLSYQWLHRAFVLLVAIQQCSAYTMTHTDVSNSTFYQDLKRQNIIVSDSVHAQSLERKRDSANSTNSYDTSIPTLDTASGLPVPFDTSLGSNFSSTACPAYFQKFLSNDTFLSCLPLSLLLQNSMSFFQAARSAVLLSKTLDKSCSASLAVCSPLMGRIANDLISQSNCLSDYNQQNPLVLQAYAGLKAYEPLYQATCSKNTTTNQYCFVEAMESYNSNDTYPYYTAVGLQLPVGSKPECTPCLKDTMKTFAGYAVLKDQPLSGTYLGSATQIDSVCGSEFASIKVQSGSKVAMNSAIKSSTTRLASILSTVFIISLFT